MKSRRAADSLGDGFEPAPLPAPGPDGLPDMSSLAAGPPPEPPPRICEYGPCRHYHTFTIVMDAARPMDGSESETHVERQHYCYPTAGVETDLGNTPVTSCNRWRPQGLITIGVRRRYERDVERWAWRRAGDRIATAALEADAANDLAEADAARAAASSTPSSEGNA